MNRVNCSIQVIVCFLFFNISIGECQRHRYPHKYGPESNVKFEITQKQRYTDEHSSKRVVSPDN